MSEDVEGLEEQVTVDEESGDIDQPETITEDEENNLE